MRMTVPGSTSGVQKTVALVAASDGSIAKEQPPTRPDQRGEALGGSGGSLAFGKISLVLRVAPQPFPRQVRRVEMIEIVVGLGGAPARCIGAHVFPPPTTGRARAKEEYDRGLSRWREAAEHARRDARITSRLESGLARELTVTVFTHPPGPGEVAAVHAIGALGFLAGIDAEQDRDRFAPIGAVGFCVEQAQIELHVSAVVACEHRALRRLVQECL